MPLRRLAVSPQLRRCSVGRSREKTLRSSLTRRKKTLKQLKKSATAHRGTVEDLKTDLKKIASRASQSAPNGKSNAAGNIQSVTKAELEDDPSCPVHLLTEAGMGYRFQQ